MDRPRMRVTSVTIGAARPRELAAFYAGLLGWPMTGDEPPKADEPPPAGWAQIRPEEGASGPTLNFEFERAFTRPVWPARQGEQTATQHLDIWVDDLDAAVAWATDRGAVVAEVQPQDDVRVLFDPDGHPFCLFC